MQDQWPKSNPHALADWYSSPGYDSVLREAAKQESVYINQIKNAFTEGDKAKMEIATIRWLIFLEVFEWFKTAPKVVYNELKERGELNVFTE